MMNKRPSMKLIIPALFILASCAHEVRIASLASGEIKEHHLSSAPRVMVTSQGKATSAAALEILAREGNIIDAFVAASFAISVERPQSTGIGGGGFLLFYHQKENKTYAFDFREVAPLLARKDMYLSKDGKPQPMMSQEGALAVAVPGLVAGLYETHKKFGKLKWEEVMAPAIDLAEKGFPLYPHLKEAIKDRSHLLRLDPELLKIFFTDKGEVPELGQTIIQPQLAQTLKLIAEKGRDGFYKGKIAKSITDTIRKHKGIMSLRDLRTYEVKTREPVSIDYKGMKVVSMPPPSSGGIHVLQILKMIEPYRIGKSGPQSVEATHRTALAMQRAFKDRAEYLGDPDFANVPTQALISPEYLKQMSDFIGSKKAIRSEDVKKATLPYESSETTHFTIADAEGNMIASTQTINGWFGAGLSAKGTGIVLNNEMDDFAQKAGAHNLFGALGGDKNLVEAKKRPLSSMSPTIVIGKNNQAVMGLGSPSGTRIINCVAQTLLNVYEFKMPLYEAVAATRIHHQFAPDEIRIEEPFLDPSVEDDLKEKGYTINHAKLGCSIQAIKKENGNWTGVSDPRGEGMAEGF